MRSIEVTSGGKWNIGNEQTYSVDVSVGSPYYDSVNPDWLTVDEARSFADGIYEAAREAAEKNATVAKTTVIETRDSPVRRVYSMLVRGELGGPLLVPESTSQKSEG